MTRGAAPHLWVVASGVVQQSETDLMQALDLTGVVVETLKSPTADIPWTHQATLNLCWERQKQTEKEISINFPTVKPQERVCLPHHRCHFVVFCCSLKRTICATQWHHILGLLLEGVRWILTRSFIQSYLSNWNRIKLYNLSHLYTKTWLWKVRHVNTLNAQTKFATFDHHHYFADLPLTCPMSYACCQL